MKVGDQVAIIGYLGVEKVSPIDRETKLYWCVDSRKFRKSDLREPSCIWTTDLRIEQATQEHIDELKKRRLVSKLSATKWEKLDLETLEKVFAAVCGMTDTKENEK